MNFFAELKRRNVFKVAAAYSAVAWMFLELSALALNAFSAPAWVMKVVIFFAVAGFAVAVLLAWAFELTPEGIRRTSDLEAATELRAPRSGRWMLITISALVLALLLVVVDSYVLEDAPEVAKSVSAETPALVADAANGAVASASPANEKSIAVLPFRDLSPTGDQAWFADGISEEISNLLTRVEDLLVINTNSSFQFRDQEQDFRSIRDTLQVNYLLSGSIRRADDELRITVQLTSTKNGSQSWSNNYVGAVGDVFDLQESIAQSVSQALQVRLGTGTFGRTPGMTRNVEAYEKYLAAQNVRPVDNLSLAESTRARLNLLEEALLLDPGFSKASARIAATYISGISFIATAQDFPERERRLSEALAHVRAVDPADPSLLVLEARRLMEQRSWLSAEQNLAAAANQVLSLGLTEADFGSITQEFLMATGRVSEAIGVAERARVRDPLNYYNYYLLAEMMSMRGNVERALEVNSEGLALPGEAENTNLYGSRTLLRLAENNAETLARICEQNASSAQEKSETMLCLTDQSEAGLELVRGFAEDPAVTSQGLGVLSAWAAFYGEPEYALELMQRRLDLSVQMLGWIYRPLYADMRKLPEFKELVMELGLVDYWRATGNWGDFCRPLPETENDFECF